jgi:O-glycosyl hydrolase
MSQTASIFHPTDTSLQARIEAAKNILIQRRKIKQSIQGYGEQNENGRLGSMDELKDAQQIIEHSFEKATQSLSLLDLKKAKELGILSLDAAHELSTAKAKFELTAQHRKLNERQHSRGKK